MKKIIVTLKDPDVLYDSIEESIKDEKYGLSDEKEIEAVKEIRKDSIRDFCGKWCKYGEYFQIEFDFDNKTAKILDEDEMIGL